MPCERLTEREETSSSGEEPARKRHQTAPDQDDQGDHREPSVSEEELVERQGSERGADHNGNTEDNHHPFPFRPEILVATGCQSELSCDEVLDREEKYAGHDELNRPDDPDRCEPCRLERASCNDLEQDRCDDEDYRADQDRCRPCSLGPADGRYVRSHALHRARVGLLRPQTDTCRPRDDADELARADQAVYSP